jgi:hypothetical protein
MHRRPLTTLVVLTVALMLALTSAAVAASLRNFVAPMDADQEVADPPVISDATGVATFQLSQDGTELSYRVNVGNIENVTQAHIHWGPRGVNGPIIVWLYPDGPPLQLIPGRSSGTLATGTITDDRVLDGVVDGVETVEDLVREILAGNAYVNVHTLQFPPGEIRGQIDRPRGHIH